MRHHELRWAALVSLSLLLGLCLLLLESFNPFGAFPARPEWLWCLAFAASLRASPAESIGAFAWCGFVRDMLFGFHPGAAEIAFVLVGWAALRWKPLTAARGPFGQAAGAGAGGFFCALARRVLETGATASPPWDRIFFISVGDGMLTALLFVPLALFLSLPPFRPWRERPGLFT